MSKRKNLLALLPTLLLFLTFTISSTYGQFISELSYNPCSTAMGQGNDADCEYIIISNPGAAALDIGGYTLGSSISFTFPQMTIIPAGGTLSVGTSPNCPGLAFDLAGFTGNLGNTGGTVELADASDNIISTVTYTNTDGADGNCMALCFDESGAVSECVSSLEGVVADCMISGVTLTNVQCTGDDAVFTICADITDGSGDYDIINTTDNTILGGVLADAMSGNVCITSTVAGPTIATVINVDFVDATDATCAGGNPIAVNIPECPSMNNPICPAAFISEIAYDCNESGDPNEAIEVCVPNTFTGNLADLSIELYRDVGTIYGSFTLDQFTQGSSDGTNTYYSLLNPSSTIQNGPGDGIALAFQGMNCQLLSYEGTLTAVEGSANGMTSTDIGVIQDGSETCDMSLFFCDGVWQAGVSTFGDGCDVVVDPTCNAAISTFPANGN